MSDANIGDNYRNEKVAPEGAWGYLIAIGIIIPMSLSAGFMHSFGILFGEYFMSIGAPETSSATIIIGTGSCVSCFAGMIASALFKKFSIRSIGVLGGVLYFFGSFISIFGTCIEMFVVAAMIQSVGSGLMSTVGYTTFNYYFIKRRVFVMSLTSAVKGIVIMLHPICSYYLMKKYGFRGALAINAAINSHAIFGMLLMHPVEWHLKVVRVPNMELKSLNDRMVDMESDEKNVSADEYRDRHGLANVDLLIPMTNKNTTNFGVLNPIEKRIASIMSLSDLPVIDANAIQSSKSGIWQMIVSLFELNLLKDFVYMNIVIGMSLTLISDGIFVPVLPVYLHRLGFHKKDITTIVAVDAGADLISRVFLAIMSVFVQPKARYIFLFGAVFTVIIRCVLVYTTNLTAILIVIAIMGSIRTCLHVTVALIYGDHLPAERFAAGYGFFMFLQGITYLTIGPFVGWIRDYTQSYELFLHMLTFLIVLCVIFWFIEIIWFKNTSKKELNTSN